jgi:hypothetical protein
MKLTSIVCVGHLLLCAAVASASLTDGLVAYYPFNGNANDASGNERHGIVYGATLTADQAGNANSAYAFDGADDYISLGSTLPDMTEMTLSIWLYQPSNNALGFGIRNIFVDAAELPGVKLLIPSDYTVEVHGEKNGFTLKNQITTGQKLVERWVNITWIMTGSYSSVFVDGNLLGRVDVGGSNVGKHAAFLGIHILPGFGPFGSYWPGKVSSLRIYDRVLSQTEVQELYRIGSTSGDPGAGGTGGDSLYVDDDAPADPRPRNPAGSDPAENGTREHPYDSIQEGIEAAADGQKVVVLPGLYRERIDFLGKSIIVTGFDPDAPPGIDQPCPVIDGNYEGTVVTFANGESAEAQLCGFTITRGKGKQAGGILCSGSSPVVWNCLIVGNKSQSLSGGGAIYCVDSDAVFDACTIAGNYGGQAGAGSYYAGGQAVMMNSILWANVPAEIGTSVLGNAPWPWIVYSDVNAEGLPAGNIEKDPLFVAPGHWAQASNPTVPLDPSNANAVWTDGDYHLQSQSPCIDKGDPGYLLDPNQLDLDGRTRIANGHLDMGAYEYGSAPRPTGLTFIAAITTHGDASIVLTPDAKASNPAQTYVGETTLHLDASTKLRLLAQATEASAAGGTWSVSLQPSIIGPGVNIAVKVSVRGEGIDTNQITGQKGKVILAEIEIAGVRAP